MTRRLCLVLLLTALATSPVRSQTPRQPEPATAESLRAAAARLEDAISGFRTAGDRGGEADALISVADVYQRLSDNRRAVDAYTRALSLYRDRANRSGEAAALNGLGSTYGRLSDYQKAIDAYQQALPLFRADGNRKGEAAALAGIGAAYVRVNRYDEGRTMLEQSMPVYRAVGDRGGEAAALWNLGNAVFLQDDYPAATSFYEKALALSRATGNRSLEGTVLLSTGQVFFHLSDYQRALTLYGEALAITRALPDRSREAVALGSLARVYNSLGDYANALDHYAQSVAIFRATGERLNEATSLNNSAHVYLSMREYRQALPLFEQSLQLSRTAGNRAGEASNTNGIGLVRAGLGEYEQALGSHRDALQIFRAIGHRRAVADSLGHIGRANQGLGDHEQARAHFNEALAVYRALGVPRKEAETLFALARTERAAGDLSAARSHLDSAIGLVEGFRQGVSSDQLRSTYLASVRDLYELKIDVLMQLHVRRAMANADQLAFETSERARARSLLDLLAEARADIRAGVDPSLLDRERTARERLAGRAERQSQLASAPNTPPDQLAAIGRDVEASVAEYRDVQATIRDSSPRYAALMQPEPITLRNVQTQLLDADTVLLEYFLGVERSYLFAVTADAIAAYELPARAEIESAARRFHEFVKDKRSAAESKEAARRLSHMLLAPVADRLDAKRLAIVADGALHYVPFAALPEPHTVPHGNEEPLIVRHEVVSLPSASTAAVLRAEAKSRATAPNLIAVIADPVFDASDVRVRRKPAPAASSSAGQPAEHAGLLRSVEDIGLGQGSWPLPRLLGTRREARAIVALAPAAKSRQALDFDASRETATGGDLGTYQVVHFATHALINNEHPELSGLVLSLVDREGRPRDGFLRLNDIYNIRLPAELVVLSACQTGLGKEIRGEGLIGLTRGFMYAGAPRVITSLWQVDDKATSELMGRFYRGLLGEKKLGASRALREAQIEMWRHKDWQSLYYWAAFALQGEWQH